MLNFVTITGLLGKNQDNSLIKSWEIAAKEGMTVFYSGDFDPEGLKMAERLLNRYPDNVKLWRYDIENYKKCISRTNLSEKRLKMLENLNAGDLTAIKNEIKHTKKAGYQEELINLLVKDIK